VSVISTDTRAPAALARVAARLVDPSSGHVLLDGKDLRDLHLHQLRRRCIVVSADPMLFTGSIAENICCGEAFSSQQIDDACRRTGSLECFKQLPQGLDTIVGPLGIDLPEVTEYRVALARALIRDPRLLIIEEPQVDNGQLEQLGEAIDAAAAGCTTLVLAAEAEQLRRADRVLLIHQGRFAETGSHAELLRDSDLYRHLNYMRFHPYRYR
jgi:ABC-type multidrug transport system fused ATPase/permease subunit